jgi:hypothetical protein
MIPAGVSITVSTLGVSYLWVAIARHIASNAAIWGRSTPIDKGIAAILIEI